MRALGVQKRFGTSVALDEVDLVVEKGALVALLGPSGSGKTTLLRIIAGFEAPDAGTVEVGGRVMAGPGTWVEPDRRRVGMVFQDGALFPHLTVDGNVGFGQPDPARAGAALELVGLAHRGRSYPHELSGGERQRVALARALAMDPEVVLLDEPFAALDAGLRASLREEVAAILRAAGASALLVTHDQQEAMSMADELVVMRAGRVEQAGPPDEVYAHPATRWSAQFLGAADVLAGVASGGEVTCELGRFPAEADLDGPVDVVVRPESVALAGEGGGPEAVVVGRSFYGHDQLVRLELASGLVVQSRVDGTAAWRPGDAVRLRVVGPVSVLAPGG
ncbi:ABC transporter ATP-binding protein [Iamia sp. SCSIO 61187]|nr:ABC transporter ATP-binding protein [Iamia sp. SCSIO 61187]